MLKIKLFVMCSQRFNFSNIMQLKNQNLKKSCKLLKLTIISRRCVDRDGEAHEGGEGAEDSLGHGCRCVCDDSATAASAFKAAAGLGGPTSAASFACEARARSPRPRAPHLRLHGARRPNALYTTAY
jgi:hypothetical protein